MLGYRQIRVGLMVACACVLMLSLLGCTSVRYKLVKEGMSRTQAKVFLGKPEKATSHAVYGRAFGPQPNLPESTPYDSWKYSDSKRFYLIFFSGAADAPRQDWKVVGKTSYPTDVVF
jgi:hypothetical protein